MQQVFQDHLQRSDVFYDKLVHNKILFGHLALPRKCAYTFKKLRLPVRSSKCHQINCVYDYSTLETIFRIGEQKHFKCIICNEDMSWEELFYDHVIGMVKDRVEKVFIDGKNQLWLKEKKEWMKCQQILPTVDSAKVNENNQAKLMEILLLNQLRIRGDAYKTLNKEGFGLKY